MPGGGAVEAEVVGFNGDKLYMMPTDDVFRLAPGARVLPMEVGVPRLVPGKRIGPRRRAADRAKHLPVGDALLGLAAWSTAPAAHSMTRPLGVHPSPLAAEAADQPAQRANRSASRWMSASAASTACSPSAVASAWACSPVPAWANRCCWA